MFIIVQDLFTIYVWLKINLAKLENGMCRACHTIIFETTR